LCCSETWLSTGVSLPNIKKFKIIRLDSADGFGGVCQIMKASIKASVHTVVFKSNTLIESLTTKLQVGWNKSFYLTTVYTRPNNAHKPEHITQYIELLNSLNPLLNSFVVGDFNCDRILWKSVSNRLISTFQTHGYEQLVKTATCGTSILDLVFTNISSKSIVDVINPHISNHFATILSADLRTPKPEKIFKSFRSLGRIDFVKFVNDFTKTDLSYEHSTDIDSNWDLLCSKFIAVFDENSPIQSKYFTNKPENVISTYTRKYKLKRNKLYNKYTHNPTEENWSIYKSISKYVRKCIKYDTCSKVQQDIKDFGVWPTLNSLRCTEDMETSNEFMKTLDPDDLNKYLCTVATEGIMTTTNIANSTSISTANLVEPEFKIRLVNHPAFFAAWKKLKKKNKAWPDSSGLSMRMINLIIYNPKVSNAIIYFLNQCRLQNRIPNCWKINSVIPLPKVSNPMSYDQIRPISQGLNLAKLDERIIYDDLIQYINDKNILYLKQFGFRPKHSTEHALISLTEGIFKGMEGDKVTFVIALDLRKAFDTVLHDLLLLKLSSLGIATEWLSNYLTGRSQYVMVGNNVSSRHNVLTGVPQGSVLGPLLFSLFINDLPKVLKACIALLFADDTNLTISCRIHEIPECISKIERDLENVMVWMDENCMKLNISKTKLLIIGSPANLKKVGTVTIKVRDIEITNCNELKTLGVILDSTLSWLPHILSITRKCYLDRKSLSILKPVLSQSCLKLLVEATILPKINYCIIIWGLASKININIIEQLIRSLGRTVLGLKKYDRVKLKITEELGWLFPKKKYNLEVLNFVYRNLRDECPPIFKDYFAVSTTQYITRTTRKSCVKTPSQIPKNKMGRSTILFEGTRLWLLLPDELKLIPTQKTFKNAIHDNLLSDQRSESCDTIDNEFHREKDCSCIMCSSFFDEI
jgi:Reverse transcriptase (RNA-dependent DNA polymerase)/Endonuclease-reverse transcriptase